MVEVQSDKGKRREKRPQHGRAKRNEMEGKGDYGIRRLWLKRTHHPKSTEGEKMTPQLGKEGKGKRQRSEMGENRVQPEGGGDSSHWDSGVCCSWPLAGLSVS